MKVHWHFSAEDVLVYGVSAIIVINLARMLSAQIADKPGLLGSLGRGVAATVHFG